MKFILALGVALGLSACVAGGQSSNSINIGGNLDLIDENHAEINRDGVSYVLDSYIVPFQRPYYITVKRTDGAVLTLQEAESIAVEYIAPRGCTSPLERRADLDQHNQDQTEWMIGISC
ncbi:hypothetical protein KRX19_06035 [Cardiobacteriaceae bacterium TAE3-ERU3]|nr:hypothetical protein [Cardiobacteriaceae bacterium TAE3-ERU3]